MDCPTCHASLTADTHENVAIDRCPAGHGIWLDDGELRTLVDTIKEARPPAELQQALAAGGKGDPGDPTAGETRTCPKCGMPLERIEYDEWSGIYIDSCFEDGVWLDAGELQRLEAWIEGSKQELAPIRATIDRELGDLAELDRQWSQGKRGMVRRFVEHIAFDRDSQQR